MQGQFPTVRTGARLSPAIYEVVLKKSELDKIWY